MLSFLYARCFATNRVEDVLAPVSILESWDWLHTLEKRLDLYHALKPLSEFRP